MALVEGMAGIFGKLTASLGLGGEAKKPRSDRLIYAVGDVHGRADLMEVLLEKILVDALRERERSGDVCPPVVFLGDVVDRGPDSKGALELLCAIRDWPEIAPILLMGNHEAMLLKFLSDPVRHRRWLTYGGYETLVSYGLGRVGDLGDETELQRIAAALAEAMGDHLEMLQQAVTWHVDGNLAFVHAGADPDLPIEMQPEDALIWGTEAFERKRRRDGIWIVHGHTIVEKPVARRGRIPLDTGAYITGVLTALKIHGTDLRFLNHTGAFNAGGREDD